VANSYGSDALVVAATARSGALASYSQRGTGVDVAAPGGDPHTKDSCTQADCITSLYPGNRYAVAAGTSMAAPHVSGLAALLLGQDGARTRDQVMQRITSTARPLAQAGNGLVDAAAALGVKQTTAPRSSAQPKPVPIVRPRRSAVASPSASPAPRRTAAAPTLAPSSPVASARPLPPVLAPVSPSPEPQAAPAREQERVPLPLAVLAAALVVAAGGSVVAASRRG
jgi:subtilisin family serine protease